MTLARLGKGQKGRIVKLEAQGALRQRLLAMGIHEGATVRTEATGPFKSTLKIFSTAGSIALRRSEAETITIEPIV